MVLPLLATVSLPVKITLPIVILAATAAGAWWLSRQKPAPDTIPQREVFIPVTAAELHPQDYTIVIPTYGEVRARTESSVIPEVSGMIREISPNFREGSFFESGEELLKLDDRDQSAAVTIAQSAVAQAETAISEENARAAQALEDWKALGRSGEPDPLVLRKPQLAEAEARLLSSRAQLDRARRDLDRTSIKAPYAGRIVEKLADVGQYVTPGRELAKIYGVDAAEIDLPVKSEDLAYLNLPEHYRGETTPPLENAPAVTLTAPYAGRTGVWNGSLVRVAGTIDKQSRQLYITAMVQDPYARRSVDNPPLKMGMWVSARIRGRTLQNVFVAPRLAMRGGDQLLIIDEENRLRTRKVTIAWGAPDHVVISEGLKPGELLCTVPLHYAVEGSKVKVTRQPMPKINLPDAPAGAETITPAAEADAGAAAAGKNAAVKSGS